METESQPGYAKVKYWVDNYGSAGIEDKRGLQDFVICETVELINSLRGELYAMSKGRYRDEILDKLVGVNRRSRHNNSYAEWARMMLLWMAEAKP